MKKLYYNKIEIWKYNNNNYFDVCYCYFSVKSLFN